MLATPIDFLNVYLAMGIMFSNDRVPVPGNSQEMDIPGQKTLEYLWKYCEFFIDLCLQEYDFQRYESQTIAVAVIMCAWKGIRVVPLWNPELAHMTGLTEDEIMPCYEKIY